MNIYKSVVRTTATARKSFVQSMGNSSSLSQQERLTEVEANAFIQSTVKDNCVVIFSKTDCPYSNQAKKIFDNMGIRYCTVELNERQDGASLQNALQNISGARTVPRVFINGNCIGGGMDTEKLHRQGKLETLIHQCLVNGKHICK